MGHDFLVIILTLDLGFKQYSINCRANLPCPNDMWYNRSHLSSPRKPSKIPFHHTQVWRPWKGGGPYTMWIEYQYLKLQNCLGNYNNKKEKNEEGGGGDSYWNENFPSKDVMPHRYRKNAPYTLSKLVVKKQIKYILCIKLNTSVCTVI